MIATSQALRRQRLQHPTSCRSSRSGSPSSSGGRSAAGLEEQVVDALGVGLDVTAEAAEELADRGEVSRGMYSKNT